jgi:hypothetical protein
MYHLHQQVLYLKSVLPDGGVTNLLILEAQEEIGGRVKSTVLPSGLTSRFVQWKTVLGKIG